MHAITVSDCSIDGPWHAAFGGGGGQQVFEACICTSFWSLYMYPVPGVHNVVKSGVFELYFLFCLSWTHKRKSAYSFLSLGSYLNMYHGYASLKKEHFLPVFTEKRAPFQHILRDAKSTKCKLHEKRTFGKGLAMDHGGNRRRRVFSLCLRLWPSVIAAHELA